MNRRYCARGFTLIELLAVLAAVVLIGFIFLLPSMGRTRTPARMMKDATQVRGIQQAMAIWANQNAGLYPYPSKIDSGNTTVADIGTAKDTTANILSVLIYTGGISVELCISPAESATGSIMQDDDYMFDVPKTAIDPANALWDPAFAADFTNGRVGNNSYAHVMPGGGREALWQDTFQTTQPIAANRGPEVASVRPGAGGRMTAKYVNPDSNTFLIHGSRKSWEGNVAYNDGHVNFETSLWPTGATYRSTQGKNELDCLFFDEPDDAGVVNAFMSIWTKAGDTKPEFKGIWD